MKKKIHVMIVDDHFMVRMGLASAINSEPDMAAVAEAGNAQKALELYRKHHPDVVLMDVRLPGTTGIEATTMLRLEFPQARVIMISSYDGCEDIYRALQVGAVGYLTKSSPRNEVLQAIRAAHAGENYLPAAVASRLAERLHTPELSARELEVLQHIVKGRANKEIAATLQIAEITVKNHVSSILTKLRVLDRTQASTVAIQRGIVHLD